jgi:hypothetical protein
VKGGFLLGARRSRGSCRGFALFAA